MTKSSQNGGQILSTSKIWSAISTNAEIPQSKTMIGSTNSMGRGITSDDTTTTRDKVLAGTTYLGADTNDETGIGTMPNRANWTGSVPMNGSVTIPDGAHKSSKVNGPSVTQLGAVSAALNCGQSKVVGAGYTSGINITANSLASQTPGNLAADKMLAGTYGVSNGIRVDGNIASIGAQTLSPQTYAQTVSSSGKYMTGNVIINAVTPPPADKLVEGYYYMGVTGTAKTIPSGPSDIYNRGTAKYGINRAPNNSSGCGYGSIDSGQLTVHVSGGGGGESFYTSSAINCQWYKTLRIEHNVATAGKGINVMIYVGGTLIYRASEIGKLPTSLSVVEYQISGVLKIYFNSYEPNTGYAGTAHGPIFRIWLE